jgi:hypothetical protein
MIGSHLERPTAPFALPKNKGEEKKRRREEEKKRRREELPTASSGVKNLQGRA